MAQVDLRSPTRSKRFRTVRGQRRIKSGDARTLKMLALAMDAGFASKSTFNQAFKKHTNQTPSDFRQAVSGRPSRSGRGGAAR